MSIISILRDTPNNVSIVRIISTDDLATISQPNYISNQMDNIRNLTNGFWQWFTTDMLLISASDKNAIFQFTDTTFSSLQIYGSPGGGVVTPGLANQIAYYPSNGDTISGLPVVINKVLTSDASGVPGLRDLANVTVHGVANYYVSTAGTDTPTSGSLSLPFQTIAYAMSQLPINSNGINLNLLDGPYVEPNQILFKPYVNLLGITSNFTFINNAQDIGLDPAWSGLGGAGATIMNMTIGGNVNFDFTPFPTTNTAFMQFFNIYCFGTFTYNGGIDGAPSGSDCYMFIYNSFMYHMNIDNLQNHTSISNIYADIGNYGTNGGANFSQFSFFNDTFQSNLNISGAGAAQQTAVLRSCSFPSSNTVNLTGPNLSISLDVESWSQADLSISGSPTITLSSSSDGLDSSYIPVNYIPVADPPSLPSSVQAHLHGIDNALGGSDHSSSFGVFVSPDGNDTTGSGSAVNPYQTIVHALSTITTNSSSNVFNVILTGGVYNESSQIELKPWVNLVGLSQNTIINNSSDIILDSSWGSTTNAEISIGNLSINNNLTIDFNSVPSTSEPNVKINNVTVDGTITLQGNATNPCTFLLNSNYFLITVINNAAQVISNGNFYISEFTSGTTLFITDTNYFSTGDFYDADIALIGADSGINTQNFSIRSSTINTSVFSIIGANSTLSMDESTYLAPAISSSKVIITSVTKTILTPLTGNTITLSTQDKYTILNPAGTLATLTIEMPNTPGDGQLQTVSTTQTITSLTVSGNSNSIIGQPTTLLAGQSFTMIFDQGTTTWYPS